MTDYRRMVWQYYANVIAMWIEFLSLLVITFFLVVIPWCVFTITFVVFLVARFVDKRTAIYGIIRQ